MTNSKYSIEKTDHGVVIKGQISAQDLCSLLVNWYAEEEDTQAMIDMDLARMLDATVVVVHSVKDGASWFEQVRKSQMSILKGENNNPMAE
jgi:hypothetical protein